MKVKNEIKIIPGAPLEGLNPLPAFRERKPTISKQDEDFPEELKVGLGTHKKVLPYLLQDRYSRKRTPLRLRCLVLENEYLRAEFLPEYGGRLYSLYDKVNKCDLVLRNPAIQPGNLAIRNAWLSGGIEWNCGNIGHCVTTCDNVFSAILTDDLGNEFIRIYEFERLKNIFWQIDFHLPEDSEHLISHVRLVNPMARDTTTYWWTNIAVEDTGKTRILASDDNIITFIQSEVYYEKLPYIKALPGHDVTYPGLASRSFDFFIQPENKEKSTWEAAAYESGLVFYERSTAPLSYKKLFCWGNHHAGKHWQEFLSDKGNGYYAEIQAGIAPSQVHDMIFPKNSKLEWTQVFGSAKLDRAALCDEEYKMAQSYLGARIDEKMSEKKLLSIDERVKRLANTPVPESSLVTLGTGFGALEIMRMERDGDGAAPKNLAFPRFTIGKAEYPWLYLLENERFPKEDTRTLPESFMISDKWIPRMRRAAEAAKDEAWFAYLNLGVALYETSDNTRFCNEAYSDEENERQTLEAERTWKRSLECKKSYHAYRNLAILEAQRGDTGAAEAYYDLAISTMGAYDDYALASEYLGYLADTERYEKLWQIYTALPENLKRVDRIDIFASRAAVKLGNTEFLDGFFAREHHDRREGEQTLTDVWFEYSARKIARERGITALTPDLIESLIDEAWDTCPPSEDIDFRMSFDRKIKYRV